MQYFSSMFLQVLMVLMSTTCADRLFQTFTTRLMKKVWISFVLNNLPIILYPLFLVAFEISSVKLSFSLILSSPLKILHTSIRFSHILRLHRLNKFISLSRSSQGLLQSQGIILFTLRCITWRLKHSTKDAGISYI